MMYEYLLISNYNKCRALSRRPRVKVKLYTLKSPDDDSKRSKLHEEIARKKSRSKKVNVELRLRSKHKYIANPFIPFSKPCIVASSIIQSQYLYQWLS